MIKFQPLTGETGKKISARDDSVSLYWIKKPNASSKPYLAVTIAPTTFSNHEDRIAPAGEWQIKIANATKDCHRVHFQVQRDDTLPGHKHGGRQSYLVAPGGDGYDETTRDFRKLTSESAVTHKGTHSGFASLENARIFRVGAANKARKKPADYTASGGGVSISDGPDCAAIGDDSNALRGVLATGTLSGSVYALSGTSAAAPQITRLLYETKEIREAPSPNTISDQSEELAKIETGSLWLPPENEAARLGKFVANASRNGSERRRRVPD